jgi:DNA-binding transcriptional MerR regulator
LIPAGLGRQPGLHIDFCTFAQGTCSDDFECAIIQGAGKEARYAMSKAADAFRTISEVADDLEVPKHVLRFWENRFPQIKPMKRGGGRRYYRPADLELLRGIRHLLHTEGYTIKGVQKILREQGVEIVKACWLPGRGLRDAAGGRKGTAGREAEVVVSASGKPRAGPGRKVNVRGRSPERPATLAAIVQELEACRALLTGSETAGSASGGRGRRRSARPVGLERQTRDASGARQVIGRSSRATDFIKE